MLNILQNDARRPAPSGAEATLDRLLELAPLLAEQLRLGLAERGLTQAQAAVLWQLHLHGPVIQRELSHALRVTPRHVTGLVDDLQAGGFVARDPHPTDRRATVVTLTGRGDAVTAEMDAERRAFAAQLFGGLPAEELTSFVATVDHVLDHLRYRHGER
ncbi:MAG: MarR family winged helix-turn-helix transcriptional regulator [Egibacteraceae bacterium]